MRAKIVQRVKKQVQMTKNLIRGSTIQKKNKNNQLFCLLQMIFHLIIDMYSGHLLFNNYQGNL